MAPSDTPGRGPSSSGHRGGAGSDTGRVSGPSPAWADHRQLATRQMAVTAAGGGETVSFFESRSTVPVPATVPPSGWPDEDLLPGVVAEGILLGRSASAAVPVGRFLGYPIRFGFTLLVRLVDPRGPPSGRPTGFSDLTTPGSPTPSRGAVSAVALGQGICQPICSVLGVAITLDRYSPVTEIMQRAAAESMPACWSRPASG